MTYRGFFMSGLPDAPETSGAAPDKVPPAVEVTLPDGRKRLVQVNFCKNPRCENFGVSPFLPRSPLKGADGKTPAMRLGPATHVVKLDELLGVHEARKSP